MRGVFLLTTGTHQLGVPSLRYVRTGLWPVDDDGRVHVRTGMYQETAELIPYDEVVGRITAVWRELSLDDAITQASVVVLATIMPPAWEFTPDAMAATFPIEIRRMLKGRCEANQLIVQVNGGHQPEDGRLLEFLRA